MTRYLLLVIWAFTSSCLSSNSTTATGLPESSPSRTLPQNTVQTTVDSIEYIVGFTSLVGSFRIWEEQDSAITDFTRDWLDLYRDEEGYRLDTLNYTLSKGYDECAGVDIVILESHRPTQLFLNTPHLKAGKPFQIPLLQETLWPQEQLAFSFNKQTYLLQATGKINNTETVINEKGEESVFHEVSAYKLCLTTPDKKVFTLLSEQNFNDTFMRLLFVGDLDQDSKPDFIISVPRDYEEERILVILSSQMSDKKIIAYEAIRQFDC